MPSAPPTLRSFEFQSGAVVQPSTRNPWWLLRGLGLAWVVLASGLAFTTFLTFTFLGNATDAADRRVEQQALDIQNRFQTRMSRHMTALLGGAALFSADTKLPPTEFQNFAQRLRRFGSLDGVQAIGFTRRVLPVNLGAYLLSVGKQSPHFRLWPEHLRGQYAPVELVEPLTAENRSTLGFDMQFDADRRSTMERARDLGSSVISNAVKLLQVQGDAMGFLIFTPIYQRVVLPLTVEERRQSLVGFVFASYRAIDVATWGLSDAERRAFFVSLYSAGKRPLYLGGPTTSSPPLSTRTLDIGGGKLTLEVSRRGDKSSAWDGSIALGCGLGSLVSILLFALVRVQVQGRLEALTYAERLKEARGEAVEHLRARETFLSVASHELKTPLTALQLQVDGLARKITAGQVFDGTTLKRRIDSIARQAKRLGSLVEDLLIVSQVKNRGVDLNLEKVDVDELVNATLKKFELAAARLGTELSYESRTPGVAAIWDFDRVSKVLHSLIENALRYGPGKPVVVRSELTDDSVTVLVEDRGLGIASKDQERIFNRFERASSSKHFGGLGLGLWIARENVAALGGTLTVASTLGVGATFTITLPINAESVVAYPAASGVS